MKKFLFFWLMSLGITLVYSQPRVSLEHNGNTTIFVGNGAFIEAYNAAVNGDTIFLPGGTFDLTSIYKSLKIYGAGVFPSATTTTGKTYLNGTLSIMEGASDFRLEGVEIMGALNFNTNQSINNVIIKRCKINSDINIPGGALNATNFSLLESVVLGNINIQNLTTGIFANNIIQGQINNTEGNLFTNNVFLYSYCGYYNHIPGFNGNNNLIQNNYFIRDCAQIIGGTANTFLNNVFINNPSGFGTNPTMSGNFFGNLATDILVNQSGDTFNFDHDYHLKTPASFIGTDASEVGIYGGSNPFKDQLIPENPHISVKNIATSTNTAGELQVEIKAEAQNR